jgi:hypothetical protein
MMIDKNAKEMERIKMENDRLRRDDYGNRKL